MVRVFYEPPPFGPRTNLNRTPYGLGGGGLLGRQLEYWSKQRPSVAIGVPVTICFIVSYFVTCMHPPLPFSMEPEYLAAQRAYMRYHNMNPIWGVSSKKARAMDPDA
ncbi:hypothetical protein ACA910_015315 [Epithemia clementina (nom. ined.)]